MTETTERAQVKAIVLQAQKAIEAALPEDEHDTIPEWCYVSIVETAIRALLAQPPAQGGWQPMETARDAALQAFDDGELTPTEIIDQLLASVCVQWRTMDTAPMDESVVWGWDGSERFQMRRVKVWAEPWATVPGLFPRKPTLWMPLPALPTQDKETR